MTFQKNSKNQVQSNEDGYVCTNSQSKWYFRNFTDETGALYEGKIDLYDDLAATDCDFHQEMSPEEILKSQEEFEESFWDSLKTN